MRDDAAGAARAAGDQKGRSTGFEPGEAEARAAIAADLARLNAPARQRYRTALKAVMRERDAHAQPHRSAPLTASERAAPVTAVAIVALIAVLFGAMEAAATAAVLAGGLAWMLNERDRRSAMASGAVAPPEAPEPPAARALALHRAALARSRHDYYAGAHEREAERPKQSRA